MADKNFEPSKVAKASQAAEGLCKWVRAMVLYDRVIKIVAPKKEKLAEAEQMYQQTMDFLDEKRRMLADLNEKLAALNEQLADTVEMKIDLENQVTLCKNKLIRAEKLIRWRITVILIKDFFFFKFYKMRFFFVIYNVIDWSFHLFEWYCV